MTDPYAIDFDASFLAEIRMGLALSHGPVGTRPLAERLAERAERAVEHAQKLGRPSYREAPGFTRDRWQLAGDRTLSWSVCGREKPYGGTRAMWREVWGAMRAAFWSGVHEALGTMTPVYRGRSTRLATVTGITS